MAPAAQLPCMSRFFRLFALVAATALAPAVAAAQGVPSYARPASTAAPQETVHGRIASYDGTATLRIDDDRGFVDNVRVRPTTVVQPNGAQLRSGAHVTIVGINRGAYLAASEIDVVDHPAAAAPPPGGTAAGPPPGTQLSGILGNALDSKNAYVGEPVVLTNVASTDGAVAGATLTGMVSDVTRPAQGRNAQIRIHFDTLRYADGSTAPVDGIVASMQANTKSNAGKEVGGALVGLLIGNALAKTILGVSGGGAVGAIGGYIIAKDNRADITIPAQTAVTVRLVDSRRQAS